MEKLHVYEVQIDVLTRRGLHSDEPAYWSRFYERVVTDSPERAIKMVEHYRTTWPAPLRAEFKVTADLGEYVHQN